MKEKKLLYGILIVFVFLLSIGLTYAYFSVTANVQGQSNDMEVTAGTLSILYNGGSEIIGDRIEPDWTATKTFSVTNNGTLTSNYSIDWATLTNTIERNELIMTMTCVQKLNGVVTGTCEGLATAPVATSPGTIKGNIEILKDYTHEYSIEFEFIETGSQQNYNQGKQFNGVININNVEYPWYDVCDASSTDLKCRLITNEDESLDPTPDTDVVFSEPADTNAESGLFYTVDTTNTDNNRRIYYYRGIVENNYLVFAGYCWRIIRTTEDGSIRIRYGGVPVVDENGTTCPQTGTPVNIANQVPFNRTFGDNAYGGYMMGMDNQCVGEDYYDCMGDNHSKSIEEAHSNVFSSHIKQIVDTWYAENIATKPISVTSLIADTPYCNDRSISEVNQIINSYTNNTKIGYGGYPNETIYGAGGRLISENSEATKTNATPTYSCPRGKVDKFTVNEGEGNGDLIHPVGLITADEVTFAGGIYGTNESYYLYTGESYWTMSPVYLTGANIISFMVASDGTLARILVTFNYIAAVPVISLKSNVSFVNGTGLYNNPYIVN